jgi:hypothetical protein
MPPQFPQLKMPRQPKFVQPKSPLPWDVTAAAAEMEKELFNVLIKEPAQAAGIQPPPELPGPATLLNMATVPLQGILGQITQGGLFGGGGSSPRGEPGKGNNPYPQRESPRPTAPLEERGAVPPARGRPRMRYMP